MHSRIQTVKSKRQQNNYEKCERCDKETELLSEFNRLALCPRCFEGEITSFAERQGLVLRIILSWPKHHHTFFHLKLWSWWYRGAPQAYHLALHGTEINGCVASSGYPEELKATSSLTVTPQTSSLYSLANRPSGSLLAPNLHCPQRMTVPENQFHGCGLPLAALPRLI